MSVMTRPDVIIRASDYDRLAGLADRAPESLFETASFLRGELERATIVHDPDANGVQMGARVRFREHDSGHIHEFRLVYPTEADIIQGRISVLTPIGAALIGLQEGATMPWLDRIGSMKKLTVLAVNAPAFA